MAKAPFLFCGMLAGCVMLGVGPGNAQPDLPRKLSALTPGQIGAMARVIDDPLEAHVIISTDGAFKGRRTIEGGLEGRVQMRAVIDRATHGARFEVRHEMLYQSPRKDLFQVNYRAGGALRESALTLAVHEPDSCPAVDAVGSCVLDKTIAFVLSEEVVREIAAGYEPRSRSAWAYRLKDRNGKDVTGGIAPAEAAGLLEALETWRRGSREPA